MIDEEELANDEKVLLIVCLVCMFPLGLTYLFMRLIDWLGLKMKLRRRRKKKK